MKYVILFLFSLTCFAEDRNRIVLIDSGVNVDSRLKSYMCEDGHKDFTNTTLKDNIGHGTQMVEIISDYINPTKTCIVNLKWTDTFGNSGVLNAVTAMYYGYYALENVRVVNLSLSGLDYVEAEELAIKFLIKHNIHVVVAAGNNSTNLTKLCDAFPACYPIKSKYFHVAASKNRGMFGSNYGGPSVYEWGYQSSQSTARKSGKLAKELENGFQGRR